MEDIKIKMEKDFLMYQLSNETIAGMTFKSAGNYQTKDRIFSLDILQYFQLYKSVQLKNRLITIHNSTYGKVSFFKEAITPPPLISADGIIYRGIGGVIFFPGGCPIIAFANTKANLSGIMHVSWKSLGAGIINNFIDLWEKCGGKIIETKIQILPAMCKECLNFPKEYYQNAIAPTIRHSFPEEIISQFTKNNEKKIELDLIGLIQFALKQKGYLAKKAHECTCCSKKYWRYLCDDRNGKKHRNAAFVLTAPSLPFSDSPPFAF